MIGILLMYLVIISLFLSLSLDVVLPPTTSSSTTSNTQCGTESDECPDEKMVTSDNFTNAFELPYLKVEDIEAVMLEHTSWTTNQIETFLKTLDIEELDGSSSLKSSLSGYESDSGYSTHEISPMGLPPSAIPHHYSSSLSPAITPVTPSPILSMSSASSPAPFCLYQDDLFTNLHPTPSTTSTTSAADHHHFFGTADLSLLQQVSAPPHGGEQQLFQTSTLYNAIQTPPTSQTSPTVSEPSKMSCIQSVLPPMNNISDIEANSHDVTVVPNSFCSSPSLSSSICSTVSHPSLNPQCIETASQFDSFLDGYFSIKTSTNQQLSHNPVTTSSSSSVSLQNINTTAIPDASSSGSTLQQASSSHACSNPEVVSSPTSYYTTKKENMSSRKLSSCSLDSQVISTSESQCSSVSSENGRMVIAQVLSPSKQQQPLPTPLLVTGSINNNNNGNNKSSKPSTRVKAKGRHHSASATLKSHQKGKKKSTWPKSMNSGNLMAFRNFILGKLKHTSPPPSSSSAIAYRPFSVSCVSSGRDQGNTLSSSHPHSIPSTPSFYSSVAPPTSEDIFSDFGFDPDTLLSEQSMDTSCFSPFSHHSGSISPSPVPISPSPVPVSPNLDASMQFTSLSSLSSNHSPCSIETTTSGAGNLDIDGFIQCLSVDPVSREFEESFQSRLGEDFCNVLKTDSDPLLGGLS